MSFIERSKVFVYIVYVTCCFVYGCMSVIDCNVQVFGRIRAGGCARSLSVPLPRRIHVDLTPISTFEIAGLDTSCMAYRTRTSATKIGVARGESNMTASSARRRKTSVSAPRCNTVNASIILVVA